MSDDRSKLRSHGFSQLLSKRVDQFYWDGWPPYYDRARGTRIYVGDQEFIDLSISGIGACTLGYANEAIDQKIIDAVRAGVASSINCRDELVLTERLIDLHPWFESCRYTRSGGEAMTVAVRLARAATGRTKVLFCGYHGWHDWYLAANISNVANLNNHLISNLSPVGVPKSLEGTSFSFEFNDHASFSSLLGEHGDDIAAVVVEPARSAPANVDWLTDLRSQTSQRGVALIFDEISSGFRETVGGYHISQAVRPDIAVLSKALGNGYAISAIMGVDSIMRPGSLNFISSTNWTERLGFVAATAVIDYYERNDVPKTLTRIGNSFQKMILGLNEKQKLFTFSVDGIPGLSSWKVDTSWNEFKTLCTKIGIARGVLLGNRLYPNIFMTDEHLRIYEAVVLEAVREVEKCGIESVRTSLGTVFPSGLNNLERW